MGRPGSLLVLGELAVAPALEQLGPAVACSRRPGGVVRDHANRGVEDALHAGLEQQRHLDHCERCLPGERPAPFDDPLADQRVKHRLEPRELIRPPEDDLADPRALQAAIDQDRLAPALHQLLANLRCVQKLVSHRVARQRRSAEPREGGQGL
jgi:hypothetical protein